MNQAGVIDHASLKSIGQYLSFKHLSKKVLYCLII